MDTKITKGEIDALLKSNEQSFRAAHDNKEQNIKILANQDKHFRHEELRDKQLASILEKVNKLDKDVDTFSKDLWKFQVLLISGIIGIIMQAISLFIKK